MKEVLLQLHCLAVLQAEVLRSVQEVLQPFVLAPA